MDVVSGESNSQLIKMFVKQEIELYEEDTPESIKSDIKLENNISSVVTDSEYTECDITIKEENLIIENTEDNVYNDKSVISTKNCNKIIDVPVKEESWQNILVSDQEDNKFNLNIKQEEIILPDSLKPPDYDVCSKTRPEVVKIHKAVIDETNSLIEVQGINESKEIIVAEVLDKPKNLKLKNVCQNIGDLLALRKFSCRVCSKEYESLKVLRRHEASHKNQKIIEASHKLKKNVEKVNKPPNNNAAKGMYSCICGKLYKRQSSWASCIKFHENTGLVCKWCSKIFDRKGDLRTHRCNERKVKRPVFHCKFCKKEFRIENNLTKHIRLNICRKIDQTNVATNAVKVHYSCGQCGYACSREPSYLKHMEKHKLEKKSFTCVPCGLSFASMKAFVCHKLRKHKKKSKNKPQVKSKKNKYECARCKDVFSKKSELSSHRSLHCRGGQYPPQEIFLPSVCDICSEQFSSNELMLLHKAEHPYLIFAKDDSTHEKIFFK